MATPNKGPNAERLRAFIDRGAAKDKVLMGDPAAAPLGTDEEAAGTSPTPEQVAAAAQMELARRVPQERNRTSTVVLALVVALTVLVCVGAILVTSP
jgi:hypothetical protein